MKIRIKDRARIPTAPSLSGHFEEEELTKSMAPPPFLMTSENESPFGNDLSEPQITESAENEFMESELKEAELGGMVEPQKNSEGITELQPKNSSEPSEKEEFENDPVPVQAEEKSPESSSEEGSSPPNLPNSPPIDPSSSGPSNSVAGPGQQAVKAVGSQGRTLAPSPENQSVSNRGTEGPETDSEGFKSGEASEMTKADFIEMAIAEEEITDVPARVAGIVGKVQSKMNSQKSMVLAAKEGQRALLQQKSEAAKAKVEQKSEATRAKITSLYVGFRSDLIAGFEEKRSLLETRHQESLESLSQKKTDLSEAFEQELETRKAGFEEHVGTQVQAATNIANGEADRAESELDTAAQEALQVGEQVAGQFNESKAKEASRELARRSSEDILDKKGGIRSELLEKANTTSEKFEGFKTSILNEIETARNQVLPEIEAAYQQSVEAQNGFKQKAEQALAEQESKGLQSLSQKEQELQANVETQQQTASEKIESRGQQALGELEEFSQGIVEQLESAAGAAEKLISGEESPRLSVIEEMGEQAEQQLSQIGDQGIAGLESLGNASGESLQKTASKSCAGLTKLEATAESSGTEMLAQLLVESESVLEEFSSSSDQEPTNLEVAVQGISEQAFSQIDAGIEDAKGRMDQSTEKLATDLAAGVDQTLMEAKKPLTDPLPDRCRAAAEKTNDPWWKGALRGVWNVIKGFAIVVALAAALVGIVALFGASLTFFGAMLIVGLIMVTIGTIAATRNRMQNGESFLPALGKGTLDAIGVTGLYGAVTGNDLFTGEDLGLSGAERWETGVTDGVSLLSLFAGIRAVRAKVPIFRSKAPGAPSGFVGWRNMGRTLKTEMGRFGMDLRTVFDNVYLRLRFGRTRVENPSPNNRRAGRLRNETRESAQADAPRTSSGEAIDPNTRQPIPQGQEQMGHRYGYEHNKWARNPRNQNLTRAESLDIQNQPGRYQIESRTGNQSHAYEQNPSTLVPLNPAPGALDSEEDCD